MKRTLLLRIVVPVLLPLFLAACAGADRPGARYVPPSDFTSDAATANHEPAPPARPTVANEGKFVVPLPEFVSVPARLAQVDEDADARLVTHCEQEYADNASLKAYCMRQQREAVRKLRAATRGDASELAFMLLRNHCAAEHGSDSNYSLWEYCEGMERDALRKLNAPAPASVPEAVFNDIRRKCAAEWPDRMGMREFCESNEHKGYAKVHSPGPGDIPAAVIESIRSDCARRRPDDFVAQGYCQDEGIASYRRGG